MEFAIERDIRDLVAEYHKASALLDQLVKGQQTIMSNLADLKLKMTALQKAVNDETDAETAAGKLLTGLRQEISQLNEQLKQAIANGDSATIQTVSDGLDQFTSQLQTNTTNWAAAVAANTDTGNSTSTGGPTSGGPSGSGASAG